MNDQIFHWREHVEAAGAEAMNDLQARLNELVKSIAPELENKSNEEIEAIVRDKINAAMDQWECEAMARLKRLPEARTDDD